MGWFCLFETVVPTNLLEAHALFDRTTCTGIKGRRRSEDDGRRGKKTCSAKEIGNQRNNDQLKKRDREGHSRKS